MGKLARSQHRPDIRLQSMGTQVTEVTHYASIMAMRLEPEGVHAEHDIRAIIAPSYIEAKSAAMQRALELWPPREGWAAHSAKVVERD